MAKTARIHPLVQPRLDDLQMALQKEFGITAGPEQIVGALIHGTTLGDLAGRIMVFNRYAAVYETANVANYQLPPPID